MSLSLKESLQDKEYQLSNSNQYINIIKKSKFIGLSYNVKSKEEVRQILDDLKKEYFDARHICYAYVLVNEEKQDDDGEPKGTAGIQILDAIKKENLINTLVVIIRYFGGILLGASGLIHAYKRTAYEVIKISGKTEIIEYERKELLLNYKEYNLIINNLDIKIINQFFDEEIKIEIEFEKRKSSEIIEFINRVKNYEN